MAAWLYSPTEEDEALLFTTALAGEKQVSFPVHPLLPQGKELGRNQVHLQPAPAVCAAVLVPWANVLEKEGGSTAI